MSLSTDGHFLSQRSVAGPSFAGSRQKLNISSQSWYTYKEMLLHEFHSEYKCNFM